MLFLYRIQNDAGETTSFNAFQAEGNSLSELANGLSSVFNQDFRTQFSWRLRKSDTNFGYVWRDVKAQEFDQPLEGEMAMVRLLRIATLNASGERLPVRFVGGSSQPSGTSPAIPQGVKSNPMAEANKKRTQAVAQPIRQQEPAESKPAVADDLDDFDAFGESAPAPKKPSSSPPLKTDSSSSLPAELEGLSTEERAALRIAERERQEREAQERKVQEARESDAAQAQLADAKSKAWAELRPKLEKWSGSDKDRKPIRTLLCTLHTVLWEGAKWTPTTVIVRPNEVRISFRKAMLVVHPDKVPSGSPADVQVIAKHCFENLNAAYEKFEATELKSGN